MASFGAAPRLNIAATNGQVVLSWLGTGFALQSAPNLNSPASWGTAGLSIVVNGTNFSTTTQPSGAAVFYRLISAPPAGGLVVVPEDTAFFVNWDLVAGATNYNLYLATAPGVTPTNYSTLPGGQKISGVNPPYFITGLTAGVKYYVVVTVTNGAGESLPYAEASAVFGPRAEVSGSIYMKVATGGATNLVFLPGVDVWLVNTTNGLKTPNVKTDLGGLFTIPPQPAGQYTICYTLSNSPSCGTICATQLLTLGSETVALEALELTTACSVFYGQVMLDGNYAFQGADSFMGYNITALARIVNGSGQTNTAPVNQTGQFVFLGAPPGPYLISVDCEGAHAAQMVNLPATNTVLLALPNHAPTIQMASALDPATGQQIFRATPGSTVRLVVVASDPDGDPLTYQWIPGLGIGAFQPTNSPTVLWQMPNGSGLQTMYFVVRDFKGGLQTGKISILTDPDVLFTGTVLQNGGPPTNNVQVTINQQTVLCGPSGYFSLSLTNPVAPYVMAIVAQGYELFSQVFLNQAIQGTYSLQQGSEDTFYSSAPFVYNGPITLGFPTGTVVDQAGQTYFGPVIVTYSVIDPADPAGRLPGDLEGIDGGTNYVLRPLFGACIALRTQGGQPLFINRARAERAFVTAPLGAVRPTTNVLAPVWLYNSTNGLYTSTTDFANATTNTITMPILQTGVSICVLSNTLSSCVWLEIGNGINLPVNVTLFSPAAKVKRIADRFTLLTDLPPNQVVGFRIAEANDLTLTNSCVISNSITTGPAGSACVTNKLNFFGVPAPGEMLTYNIGPGDSTYGKAYYNAIDPYTNKLTFAAWKTANGFDEGGVVEAIYFNNGDLGFGRWMGMKERTNGDISYFVSNYGSPDAAIHARSGGQTNGLAATVCMEYSSHTNFPNARYTKFYIFNQFNQRVEGVELDGRGVKFVPHLCIVCHGGIQPPSDIGKGDVRAKFLPFDLESFKYSQNPSFTQAAQAAAFKQLNAATLRTATTASITELVQGWYGGASLPGSYNKDFVASGWNGTPAAQELYSKVFKISCRSCHITRTAANKAFPNYTDLIGARKLDEVVCDKEGLMPNALRTFNIFWSSQCTATNQPLLLKINAGLSCPF
jgi:hypothetical protein